MNRFPARIGLRMKIGVIRVPPRDPGIYTMDSGQSCEQIGYFAATSGENFSYIDSRDLKDLDVRCQGDYKYLQGFSFTTRAHNQDKFISIKYTCCSLPYP